MSSLSAHLSLPPPHFLVTATMAAAVSHFALDIQTASFHCGCECCPLVDDARSLKCCLCYTCKVKLSRVSVCPSSVWFWCRMHHIPFYPYRTVASFFLSLVPLSIEPVAVRMWTWALFSPKTLVAMLSACLNQGRNEVIPDWGLSPLGPLQKAKLWIIF